MTDNKILKSLIMAGLCMALGACATGQNGGTAALNAPVLAASDSPLMKAGASPVELGKAHFKNGDYGLSERYFRKAAESQPNDAKAWIGLAASYDRLYRFKLADRAYRQAVRIEGETPAILNNWGYSKLMQGDLKQARKYLDRAHRKDPKNPHVINNLALLDASHKFSRNRAGA